MTILLDEIIRPLPRARYEVDHSFSYVEKALLGYADGSSLDLVPDFQRGHVWTQEQQERWIEAVLRGAISSAGLTIQFNAPDWNQIESSVDSDLQKCVVCIDGLQRLTAIRRFVAGEIRAFDRTADQFDGTSYDIRRYRFKVAVHNFQTRADLLQYYLDINTGGTPHSDEEIERVRAMLDVNENQAAIS